ncbi:MAG: hypothetical protein IKB02_02700, partial [Clostridia bacterium]|nr:hypothetical protein [Clostridia bacterium]
EALLAAARSHFGSDNRTGLSFTTEMPLRYLELRELLKKLDQNFLILFPTPPQIPIYHLDFQKNSYSNR